MKFNDLDEEFDFDKEKKYNVKTKIRTITLFIVFLVIISFIAKNNFSFVFSAEKDRIEFMCGPKNTRSNSDDLELMGEKARRSLNVNLEKIESVPLFLDASIGSEKRNASNSMVPIIKVRFKDEHVDQKKIPENMCNFKVILIYE